MYHHRHSSLYSIIGFPHKASGLLLVEPLLVILLVVPHPVVQQEVKPEAQYRKGAVDEERRAGQHRAHPETDHTVAHSSINSSG